MKEVLLFGGTGHLGKAIAKELVREGYNVTAAVRSSRKGEELKSVVQQTTVVDFNKAEELTNICTTAPIIISALGKSVSIHDHSKSSFEEVDLKLNSDILEAAIASDVKKFVYISALHAEQYPHLSYFSSHQRFAQKLMQSGIDYSIIKPPALFSAFIDLIDMAKKGRLMTMGKGNKLTNPIDEGDLAKVVVASIQQLNTVIEAGGPEVLSRKEINQIIQTAVAPKKKVKRIPIGLVKAMLPAVKLFSKNMYHKAAFFTVVMEDDTIAPKLGEKKLADYIKAKTAAL